jgi:hypothetical protein
VRHTKSKVIERTQHEYRQLDRLVKRLKPTAWRRLVPRPESKDPWTVKDSLSHIIYWKEHTARLFRREKRPPELRGLDVNQGNALIYRRWRDRRPTDVVAWHRRAQEDVIRTLRAQPEAWHSAKEHGASWPGDLAGHSSGHRVRDIEAALNS